MKNENVMDLYLKNNGFAVIEPNKEYEKDSWTIRIEDTKIEAYQDLRKKNYNRYICLDNTEENLFSIVDAIALLE